MKAAFTSSGDSLDAGLDPRFGRAQNFLICDTESESFEVVDNQQNLNAAQGAGVQAAENVARTGVECVVTGHCGPKAFRVLTAAGVRVYTSTAPTVSAALDQLRAGELTPIEGADVEGHWA